MTRRAYRLFSKSAWWQLYHATVPDSDESIFTVLLWRRDTVQGAQATVEPLQGDGAVVQLQSGGGEGRGRWRPLLVHRQPG